MRRFREGSGLLAAKSTRLSTVARCSSWEGASWIVLSDCRASCTPTSSPKVKPPPAPKSQPRRGVANQLTTSTDEVCADPPELCVTVALTCCLPPEAPTKNHPEKGNHRR